MQSGAHKAVERGITNINFVRARADQVTELFAPHSITDVWLTFSDPFPKKRSSGRRLTHPTFLRCYQELLSPQGNLCIKHDNRDFFCWSLEQLVAEKWQIIELSFDLHEADVSDDYKILTAYERRWLEEGRLTYFARSQLSN